MATIAVQPIVLTDVLLTLGADNYQAHVSSVEFVPTAATATWKGLTPGGSHTATGLASWVCNISFAQDHETDDSLSNFLFDNEGDTVSALFEPKSGATGFSADIVITPGSIGGSVDAFAVATVSLGVQGKPVRIPAA